MKKIISFLLVFTFGLSSCEKDDICDPDTPTTPRLVIDFYDADNPSVAKPVSNLKVIGKDMKEGIIFNENASDESKYLTSGSKISIPLKTNDNSTTYTLIYDSNNPNVAARNSDVLRFNYTHQDEYVSRACGFKTIFALDPLSDGIPVSRPFVLTDGDSNGLWIRQVYVKNYKVEVENETHIEIYF